MQPQPEAKLSFDVRFLLRFLKPYKWLVGGTLVAMLLSRITGALEPLWLKHTIDRISEQSPLAAVMAAVGVYVGLRLATAIFEYLRDIIFAPAEMGVTKTLSHQLFDHLLTLPIAYHVEQKIGGVSRKITRGTRAVTFILDFLVINILPTIFALLVTTAFLLRLYPPVYAIVTFATIVIYTWFTIWSTEKRQKYRLGANIADDEVASIEVDGLTNIDTVKYFNNEALMMERYEPAVQKRFVLALKSNQLFALISGVQGLLLLIGMSTLLILAVRDAQAGLMTIGDLVLLTTYIVQLSAPIGVLGFIYRQIKDGLADIAGMVNILKTDVELNEPARPQAIQDPRGAISFERVSFGYAGRPSVLEDVSLEVKPGQRVAFVGPSGAGKSTVVKLLFRIYDPAGGAIKVDGVDLRKLDKATRRQLFAIVPQEPALFNATIGDNIRFGKPDATDEDVQRAVQAAHLTELVAKLPDGLNTVVGERGVKLSGGEKQRVAIARAIIRDPKILVFDEATSSLDTHSEREIQKALDEISEYRTTVAVAHRLSTIKDYDRIYVLAGGTIAESGTHEQLLKKDGQYAKLWKLQAHGGGRKTLADEPAAA